MHLELICSSHCMQSKQVTLSGLMCRLGGMVWGQRHGAAAGRSAGAVRPVLAAPGVLHQLCAQLRLVRCPAVLLLSSCPFLLAWCNTKPAGIIWWRLISAPCLFAHILCCHEAGALHALQKSK